MSLRHKTLLVIGGSLLTLIVVLYVFSRTILLDGYRHLEAQAVTGNLQRVLQVVEQRLSSLASINADWAWWDETYAFVEGNQADYVEINLFDDTFLNLGINLIIFVDHHSQVVFAKAVDLETGLETALPDNLTGFLSADNPLLRHETQDETIAGIALLNNIPVFITSARVLNTAKDKPPAGTLIMGRFLDEPEVQSIAAQVGVSVSFHSLGNVPLPTDQQIIYDQLAASASPMLVIPRNDGRVGGYTRSVDLNGSPVLLWHVDMPRDIFAQGENNLTYFLLSLALIGLLFMLLVLVQLERTVLSRVAFLHRSLTQIRLSSDLTQRLSLAGNDELANLAHAANQMFDEIERGETALKEMLQFKSQVLANVSHDARTPISIISLRAEMLQMGLGGELTDAQKRMVDSIMTSSRQLMYFNNSLLDASHLESGKLKLVCREFDPALLVQQLEAGMTPLAGKKGLSLVIEVSNDFPPVLYGDPDRLNQIIFNLVGNAIKFTEQGSVTVRFFQPDRAQWALQVTDTGPGIPLEAHQRLFEAFYQVDGSTTRKQTQGVGLGLSIVKQLVDLMGGQIRVESQLGAGSTFTVVLGMETNLGVQADERIPGAHR